MWLNAGQSWKKQTNKQTGKFCKSLNQGETLPSSKTTVKILPELQQIRADQTTLGARAWLFLSVLLCDRLATCSQYSQSLTSHSGDMHYCLCDLTMTWRHSDEWIDMQNWQGQISEGLEVQRQLKALSRDKEILMMTRVLNMKTSVIWTFNFQRGPVWFRAGEFEDKWPFQNVLRLVMWPIIRL